MFAEIQIESQIFQKALPFPLVEGGENRGEKAAEKQANVVGILALISGLQNGSACRCLQRNVDSWAKKRLVARMIENWNDICSIYQY